MTIQHLSEDEEEETRFSGKNLVSAVAQPGAASESQAGGEAYPAQADPPIPLGDPALPQAVQVLPGMNGAALNKLDEDQIRSENARRVFEIKHGKRPWMNDYFELRGEGWSWRQAVYIVWASQPKPDRIPRTQGELAVQELGLTSDRQIRKWRMKNPMIDLRVKALTISALAKARAEVYAALITAASNPNPRAHADRKLALEMLGDYVPRQKVAIGPDLPDDLSELDEGELRALALAPGEAGE